jgi:hypothetical protein
VCAAKAERMFNIRLEKLKQMMNLEAKEWLEEQMVNKHKWANAFDEGGWRYGVNNTNLSEVLNKVLKGIRAMLVSAIVEYTFYKINSYFVHRWKKARDHIDRGLRGVNTFGKAAKRHLTEQGLKVVSMRAELFDPTLYVYSVRTASALNVRGEMIGGRIYKVDLSGVTCTCCIPQLLHVPCSHMIATCTVRGVSWLAPAYTTQLYSKETILKTWAAHFEPILDETHWPEYNGLDYVQMIRRGNWVSKGGRKSDYAMRWTKQVGTIGIFTVLGSLTKKSRRIDVVSGTRRVIRRNDINNLVGADTQQLLRISCLYFLIM